MTAYNSTIDSSGRHNQTMPTHVIKEARDEYLKIRKLRAAKAISFALVHNT